MTSFVTILYFIALVSCKPLSDFKVVHTDDLGSVTPEGGTMWEDGGYLKMLGETSSLSSATVLLSWEVGTKNPITVTRHDNLDKYPIIVRSERVMLSDGKQYSINFDPNDSPRFKGVAKWNPKNFNLEGWWRLPDDQDLFWYLSPTAEHPKEKKFLVMTERTSNQCFYWFNMEEEKFEKKPWFCESDNIANDWYLFDSSPEKGAYFDETGDWLFVGFLNNIVRVHVPSLTIERFNIPFGLSNGDIRQIGPWHKQSQTMIFYSIDEVGVITGLKGEEPTFKIVYQGEVELMYGHHVYSKDKCLYVLWDRFGTAIGRTCFEGLSNKCSKSTAKKLMKKADKKKWSKKKTKRKCKAEGCRWKDTTCKKSR